MNTPEKAASHKRFAILLNNQRPTLLPQDQAKALEELAATLNGMNGKERWSVNLWELPKSFDEKSNTVPFSESYLQFVGEAEAMSVEVRITGERRSIRQYTVGKPSPALNPSQTRSIYFSPYDTSFEKNIEVAENDVFTAQEAQAVVTEYYLTGQVPSDYSLRELKLSTTSEPTNDRPLTFIDAKGEELTWQPGDAETAFEAFNTFMKARIARDNARFIIEDAAADEELLLMMDRRAVCRVSHGSPSVSQYALTYDYEDYMDRARAFIKKEGFQALDEFGPWLPDEAGVKKALYQDVYRDTPLATIHPTELRHRLAVLSFINGTSPLTTDDITKYHYDTPAGQAVSAWFKPNGQGIVTTSDGAQDAQSHTDMYSGAPADLRRAAEGQPASSVFLFTKPSELSEGTLDDLFSQGDAVNQVGAPEYLERFLTLESLTPRSLKKVEAWWSDAATKAGFAHAATYEASQPVTPRDPAEQAFFLFLVDGLARRDTKGLHYVFSPNPNGAVYQDIIKVSDRLGLERVDPPTGTPENKIWIRTDPAIESNE